MRRWRRSSRGYICRSGGGGVSQVKRRPWASPQQQVWVQWKWKKPESLWNDAVFCQAHQRTGGTPINPVGHPIKLINHKGCGARVMDASLVAAVPHCAMLCVLCRSRMNCPSDLASHDRVPRFILIWTARGTRYAHVARLQILSISRDPQVCYSMPLLYVIISTNPSAFGEFHLGCTASVAVSRRTLALCSGFHPATPIRARTSRLVLHSHRGSTVAPTQNSIPFARFNPTESSSSADGCGLCHFCPAWLPAEYTPIREANAPSA